MAIQEHGGSVIITGEHVKPVAELTRLHGWKLAANMKLNHGMSSKRCPSVKAFNEAYGTQARTWAHVLQICTDTLAAWRAELDEAAKLKTGSHPRNA